MVYYVVKFLSEQYMLQYYKTVNKQVIKVGELILKAEYIIIMKSRKTWYWQQLETKDSVVVATHTIVHPCLDVSTIKYVADIPRIL